jgi:hypothetical protein
VDLQPTFAQKNLTATVRGWMQKENTSEPTGIASAFRMVLIHGTGSSPLTSWVLQRRCKQTNHMPYMATQAIDASHGSGVMMPKMVT